MEWQTALTIIVSVITAHAVVLGLVAGLINKRIEDTNKRMADLKMDINKRLDKIEEETRDIRQLLYKFFEVPQKSKD